MKDSLQFVKMRIVTSAAVLLIFVLSASAATYYVATDGNDSWNGLSPTFTSGSTGPWYSFGDWNNLTAAGDTLYIRGGIYEALGESTWFTIRHQATHTGTQANPIIITNYPGEVPVLYKSGTNSERIYMNGVSWVHVYGITISNAYRSVLYQGANNCEFARNTVTGRGDGTTSPGGTLGCQFYNNCNGNWIHHNLIKDGPYSDNSDSGHGLTVGLFFTSTDFSCFNLIESNTCYWAGHDAMSVYGPSNLIRGNWIHNEPIHYRTDLHQLAGQRCLELGGEKGNANVAEYNRLSHAGVLDNGGAHGIEVDSYHHAIIRKNEFLNSDYGGLVIYGSKLTDVSYYGSNYVYNNTIAFNGFAQRYVTNYVTTEVKDNLTWKSSVIVWSTNNFYINNIMWGNYSDTFYLFNGAANMFREAATLTSNPLFVDSTDGGPFSQTQPDVHLTVGSPAIDGGTWLTTVSSGSGSGTSMSVVDVNYFFGGLTAAGHVVPGDTIQLQGQTVTSTITAIAGNTLTLNSSLTWTNGQGVALPYNGAAPDVGAYESAFEVEMPPPGHSVNPPRSQRSFGAIRSGP